MQIYKYQLAQRVVILQRTVIIVKIIKMLRWRLRLGVVVTSIERVEGKYGGGFCAVVVCGEAQHHLQGHVAQPALLSACLLYCSLVVFCRSGL